MDNLNQFLQPFNSPVTQNMGAVSGYDFNSNYERGGVGNFSIKNASINNAKIGTAAIGTANIGTLTFNQISGGTINVLATIGTANIKLDGANNRILINDGLNDRVLIGYQLGGF